MAKSGALAAKFKYRLMGGEGRRKTGLPADPQCWPITSLPRNAAIRVADRWKADTALPPSNGRD